MFDLIKQELIKNLCTELHRLKYKEDGETQLMLETIKETIKPKLEP